MNLLGNRATRPDRRRDPASGAGDDVALLSELSMSGSLADRIEVLRVQVEVWVMRRCKGINNGARREIESATPVFLDVIECGDAFCLRQEDVNTGVAFKRGLIAYPTCQSCTLLQGVTEEHPTFAFPCSMNKYSEVESYLFHGYPSCISL